MRYLVLGFLGIWIYGVYGIDLSKGMALAIKLFTIAMFWCFIMNTIKGEEE